MTSKKARTWLAAALTMLAMTGCGNNNSDVGSSSVVPAQEIKVVAKDNVFDPKDYTAQAGKPVRLVVTNAGQNAHEVEVKGLTTETKLAPGQSKTFDLSNIAAGTYTIYCEIHEDQGMQGQLVVK